MDGLRAEKKKLPTQKNVTRKETILRAKEMRLMLKKRVTETRRESWKSFVTEGSKNPWGFAYKLACERMRTQTVID